MPSMQASVGVTVGRMQTESAWRSLMPMLEPDRLYLEPRHLALLQEILHQQVLYGPTAAAL